MQKTSCVVDMTSLPCWAILWKVLLTVGLVLFYYCFSIGITFYNKWLLKTFHLPLFMTLVHLLMIFIMSALSRTIMICYSNRSRVILPWSDYLKKVAPTGNPVRPTNSLRDYFQKDGPTTTCWFCVTKEYIEGELPENCGNINKPALATALDIGLSNWSFLYITVSLYTMTKSSAVLFILFFSLLFKLEELRPALVLVVLLISGGLFMFTFKSTQFDTRGFILVLAASCLGGIRWTLTQILMQKAELGLQNPIDTMFHLQPIMFLSLFPLFIGIEGLHMATSQQLFCYENSQELFVLLGTLGLGGLLAFGLGYSEFLLVSKTSSLTLSIAGIFKELCVLLLATRLLGDQMSLLNWFGFAVCISGIALHVTIRTTHSKGEAFHKNHRVSLSMDMEMLLQGGDDEEDEET